MAEYSAVQKGSSSLKELEKKKKDKERKHLEEQVLTAQNEEEETKKVYVDKRTPAQLAFDKIQEKREFNRHLDTLTEHYDIPKVSWTK
uniref:Family with sequence similarity 32 member A n=1 Tax=Astyanax mexicanus TaxID=7994 RepID=A0A3B1JCT9_ASTMX